MAGHFLCAALRVEGFGPRVVAGHEFSEILSEVCDGVEPRVCLV